MNGFAEFHFLRPEWLFALLPLIAGLTWFARRPVGVRIWQKVIEPHLLPHVLIGSNTKQRRWPLLMMALAGVLAISAAAGPAWDRIEQPVFRSEDALVIVLDLSRSMDAEDVSPSRLQRARYKINDILNGRPDGQTALIVFAAQAFTVSPLTDDAATIIAQLPVLTTDLVPAQGSRVDRALVLAQDLLQQSGAGRGQVLVVTDGADPGTAVPAADALAASGYRVSVMGVGTPDGGPIPTRGGFLKDRAGAIIVPRLDAGALKALAAAGGGEYYTPTIDDRDVDRILASLATASATSSEESDVRADAWRDQGYWLLLPLLPLAALVFRRGFLLSFPFLLIMPWPRAEALEWQDLWQTPDQQAIEALEQGDADRAAGLFEDPAWRAAAQYRAGQFDAALSSLEKTDGVDALYNRGNALARQGRFDEAIEAYEQALEIDAGNEDAIFNRDLLRELQQQQQQQQQGGQQGDKQDQQQQDGQQGDQQDQQQQNGEQGEQQDQQQQDGEQGEPQDESRSTGQQGEQQDSQSAGEQGAQDDEASEPESLSDEEQAQRDAAEQQFREEMREAEARAEQNADQDTGADDRAAQQAIAGHEDESVDEAQQAVEQWLRQVPDDPGGLLRRKFQLQYGQQQRQEQTEEEQQW